MVQIIQLPQKRSPMERFTEGLAQGMAEQRAEQREEKKMGLEYQYKTMLEDRKQKIKEFNIFKAAEGITEAKGVPELAGAVASILNMDPEAGVKMINNWTPRDWATMNDHYKKHLLNEGSQGSQSEKSMQSGPSSNITSGNVNPQTNTQNAANQAATAPVNPLVLQDRNNQMSQPGANMRPPSPIPVGRQTSNGQQPTTNQPMNDEDRFDTINGQKFLKDINLAQTGAERRKFWEQNSKSPDEARAKEDMWIKNEKLKGQKKTASIQELTARHTLEADQRKIISEIDNEYKNTLKKRPIYKTLSSKAVELQPKSTLKKYIMDRYNIPPGMMLNPTTEVIEKLSQQLLRGISSDYKGRILQSEVENYLKSIPSLLNSPEGMQKLAKVSMALDDIAEEKWKIKNDIVKEARAKGEMIPEDISSQILERSIPFEEDVYKKIEDIMNVKGLQNDEYFGRTKVKGPDGKMYMLNSSQIEEAKKQGYEVVK